MKDMRLRWYYLQWCINLMIFPFCIAKGDELEYVTKRSTPNMTDAAGLVQCNRETWYPTTSTGNATATIKICETSPKAHIRCAQVVADGGRVIYEKNSSFIAQYRLLAFKIGTAPLGDIFWTCEHNTSLLSYLSPNWEGICAPLMLTGQLSLITRKENQEYHRDKRSIDDSDKENDKGSWNWEWRNSGEVCISWDQIPYGVPEEQVGLSSGWIETGRALGSIPWYGQISNAQYIARNSRWVNLLWYNQQRFINFTITGLGLIKEQLHATSIMTLQNRFVIETLMAPDQGICDVIGEECCTVIPLHSGLSGNLTRVLEEMRRMRDEHVQNSNWNTQRVCGTGWESGVG
ncbi:uncharacterized protein LOC118470853 isoform X3 [Amphiprion ocellaris]|uniref:Uncharacterized protein n=1 Tax=Amphiprion ocellaris TaxID=80972 RepID=A0AAQ5ZLR2_AMPOC|nr:uncharacterized protein LOC118470853 isoform X3 [Amphiprion ocellaris]XP_054861140.1 uncharacterized protein LOC118470853 isoform X3 [Amphiprion ocellaris]